MKSSFSFIPEISVRSRAHILALLVALATPSALPAVTAVYSESFTGGQEASAQAGQDWVNFKAGLLPGDYDTVTINGTFDSTGITLTDATIVPEIAAALKNGTSRSWSAGGHT
jgi:hypothetical protein